MSLFKNNTQKNFIKEMKKLEKEGKLPENYAARFKYKRTAATTISLGTIILALWYFNVLSSFFSPIFYKITGMMGINAPDNGAVYYYDEHNDYTGDTYYYDMQTLYSIHMETVQMFNSYLEPPKNFTTEDISEKKSELDLLFADIDDAASQEFKTTALLIQKNIGTVLLFLEINYEAEPTEQNYEMIKTIIEDTNSLFEKISTE